MNCCSQKFTLKSVQVGAFSYKYCKSTEEYAESDIQSCFTVISHYEVAYYRRLIISFFGSI